jgi:hypothetical protein
LVGIEAYADAISIAIGAALNFLPASLAQPAIPRATAPNGMAEAADTTARRAA